MLKKTVIMSSPFPSGKSLFLKGMWKVQVSANVTKFSASEVFQTIGEQLNESVPAQIGPVPIKGKIIRRKSQT